MEPDHPGANLVLGDIYYRQGQYENAVASLEKHAKCCQIDCEFYLTRGFNYLFIQKGEAAANDARACLAVSGWHHRTSQYMALLGHYGYRMVGRWEAAKDILEEAARSVDTSAWPFPVIQYLRREISVDQLVARAASADEYTEAHSYVGLDLLLAGHESEAMDHFRWVRENGNQTFFEYHLAVAALNRHGQATSKGPE